MTRRAWLMSGAVAAVTMAGLCFFLYSTLSSGIFAMTAGAQRIGPGFVGVANFGRWRLICMPGPPTLDGLDPADDSNPAAQPKNLGNSCRINQEISEPDQGRTEEPSPEQNQRRVIIAANFSRLGPRRLPAIMLRVPATAHNGDSIALRFDDQALVNTIVRDCQPAECLAAGSLSLTEWSRLSSTKTLHISFPVATRQWVLLNVSVDGLPAAMAALDRAEASPKN